MSCIQYANRNEKWYTIPTIQLLKDSCIVDKGLKMGVFQREKINKKKIQFLIDNFEKEW